MARRNRTTNTGSRPTGPAAGTSAPVPWITLLLVAAGLALTVVLTYNYYQHLTGHASSCAISEYVDCDRVSESRFAAIAGVPISAAALAVYGALGVLLGLPRIRQFRRLAAVNLDLATGLTGLCVVVALALAVIAALVIRALCLYCALLQVVTLALFGLLGWQWLRSRAAHRPRQSRRPGTAAGSAVLALAAGGVVAAAVTLSFETAAINAASRMTSSGIAESGQISPYLSRTPQRFVVDDSPGAGPADAPVQVVVFGDYNCSHCRDFDPEALRLIEDFPGDVLVVFKFFPLDGTCNRHISAERQSSSCLAALAAYAAHQQNRFLDYHLLLFEHFQNHSPARLVANAQQAGIADTEVFLAALQSEAALRHVQRDIEEGARGGVQGTPTVFVNGRRLETARIPPGTTRYQILVQEIRRLLRAAL